MLSPILFTSFLASYVAAETFSLGVDRLIIKDPELPVEFHNLKVCFISDIHHGPFSSLKRLRKMVEKINEFKPDLLILGGDYLQTYRRSQKQQAADLAELLDVLRDLEIPLFGIYAVLGNHDYTFSVEYLKKEFADAGIKVLHNEGEFLHLNHAKIRLSGVGDLWFGEPDLKQAQANTKPTDFTLLISHQPNFIDQITPKDGINFVLAGHTHGGQARLFNYQPFMPHKIAKWEYTVGLIETPQTRMLVSPGIGNAAPYFRFFAPPKIHLITFKSAPRLSVFR